MGVIPSTNHLKPVMSCVSLRPKKNPSLSPVHGYVPTEQGKPVRDFKCQRISSEICLSQRFPTSKFIRQRIWARPKEAQIWMMEMTPERYHPPNHSTSMEAVAFDGEVID